jgi:hypothetical protein
VLPPPVRCNPLRRRIQSVAPAYVYRCPAPRQPLDLCPCFRTLNSFGLVTFPSRSAASTCSRVVSAVAASVLYTAAHRSAHRPAPRAEKVEPTAALVAALLIGVTRGVTAMSGSPARRSRSRSQPRPDLALLRDALREPMLPTRPPAAWLAGSLRRPPSLISHPCVSLSLNTPLPSQPIVLAHSSPRFSSIDTLKRISSTSSSAPASPTDSSPVTWSWSQFVGEYGPASRDEQAEEEQRKKCQSLFPLSTHSNPFNADKSTKNPIVFCHGLLGFDSVTIGPPIATLQVGYWRGIKEVLEANGIEVLITRVPATSSYVDRAKVLKEKISQAYAGRSVHLIGMLSRSFVHRTLMHSPHQLIVW